jgi:hypothetical protein
MFSSKTFLEHALRGAVGVCALWLAFGYFEAAWPALVLVPVALLAFRGCPMCWLVGLFETAIARIQGKTADGACTDGSCALSGHQTDLKP